MKEAILNMPFELILYLSLEFVFIIFCFAMSIDWEEVDFKEWPRNIKRFFQKIPCFFLHHKGKMIGGSGSYDTCICKCKRCGTIFFYDF